MEAGKILEGTLTTSCSTSIFCQSIFFHVLLFQLSSRLFLLLFLHFFFHTFLSNKVFFILLFVSRFLLVFYLLLLPFFCLCSHLVLANWVVKDTETLPFKNLFIRFFLAAFPHFFILKTSELRLCNETAAVLIVARDLKQPSDDVTAGSCDPGKDPRGLTWSLFLPVQVLLGHSVRLSAQRLRQPQSVLHQRRQRSGSPPPAVEQPGEDRPVPLQQQVKTNPRRSLPPFTLRAERVAVMSSPGTTRPWAGGRLTRWRRCWPTWDPRNTNQWPTPTGPVSI